MSTEVLTQLDQLARELVGTYPYYAPWQRDDIRFYDLPIIDKQTINLHRDDFTLPGLANVYESFTSGSTGIPFRCIKTPEENTRLSIAIYKHRRRWGLPLRHQMLLLSNRFLAEPAMLAHYSKQILQKRPEMIQGRLSQLYELAQYFRENNLRVPDNLLFVQNWGEPVNPAQRAEVERIFAVPVVDYYGMEEIWCIAFSNEKGDLEVDESLVYLEVVDPKTGHLLPEGEYGELLVTSLVMRSMPYVRYRTGDIARLIREEETDRQIVQLMPVRYSQIKLPGRTYQVAIFRYLDRFFYDMHEQHGVRQFQMIQETLTSFRLLVAGDVNLEVAELTAKLRSLLTRCLGVEVELAIEPVPAIAPNPVSGKYQSFVSWVQGG